MSRSPQLPADLEARRLAQSEFDRPVAVEAGAGTGKTTVLVARVLGWCLGRGWTTARWRLVETGSTDPAISEIAAQALDGVVAITFTEAAASEMARRVATALTNLSQDPQARIVGFDPELLPDADRPLLGERAGALVGALDHLAIRTIHSHCWNLLATYPMAAGLSPDLQIDAEGHHLEQAIRDVVEKAIKYAYVGPAKHPLRRLASKMIDPRQIADAIQTLVSEGVDSEALESDPLAPARIQEMCQRLLSAAQKVEVVARPIATQNRARTDREVTDAVARTLELLGEDAPDDPSSLSGLFDLLRETWSDNLLDRLHAWGKGKFTRTVDDLLGDDRLRLGLAAVELADLLQLCRRIDIDTLDSARRALHPLIAAVETELRSSGVLTYNSLMTEAWKLLAEHPEVRRREQRKLQQLMVDEFQDTDNMQCELVRFLALGGEKADRPGLFVVGDPKQSIYGWRDADLEAYEHFLEDLRGAGGIAVELSQNFRSVPAILHEVDRAIEPVMRPVPGLQPSFSSLQPSEALSADPGFDRLDRRPIEYWVSWTEDGPQTRGDDAASLEARAIAIDMRELHQSGDVPWNDFGLLLRSTSRLETYLEAFRHAGVPFVVTSDKHYYRRREIIEAAALIRTIIVPVDHLALVTFLRSATVGVPDAALLPLWQRDFPSLVTDLESPDDARLETLRILVEEVANRLPPQIPGLDRIEGWQVSLIAALESLAELRHSFRRDAADRFIRRVRGRFLLDITESARHLGTYRLANLDRFFRELESALEESGGDIQAVLRTLRRSVANAEDAEQALPEGATEDAVQVMTIHGAKGLEFGHVYLPQLHAKGRRNQWPVVRADRRWAPGRNAEYVLFGCPTLGYDRVQLREEQVERSEQIRTLYVAMTRARKRLVLAGRWPEVPSPVPLGKRATYLDLLRSRELLPDSIGQLFASCSSEASPWVDVDSVRWYFPEVSDRQSKSIKSRSRSAGFPTRKILKQQAGRLERLRGEASRHMERPFTSAASQEAAERLERLLRDDVPQPSRPDSPGLARPIGDAFHRMLESWNLDVDPDRELERLREIQIGRLHSEVASDAIGTAEDRFQSLLGRFRSGQFWDRFTALRGQEVAREVPVLLPPRGDLSSGPVGFVSGFVDLLYRDCANNGWVVVDYKTDRVESDVDIADRAEAYLLQETLYARAIREALGLEQEPITQLWFIWPDYLWEEISTP